MPPVIDRMLSCAIFGLLIPLIFMMQGGHSRYQQGSVVPKRPPLKILLLGKVGHGKSALGNLLLGRKEFESRYSGQSVTQEYQDASAIVGDRQITVIDTPGIIDLNDNVNHFMKLLATAIARNEGRGFDAFLVVLSSTVRITQEERDAIIFLKRFFGETFFNYVIFVYTHKDVFEGYLDSEDSTMNDFNEFLGEQDNKLISFFKKASWRIVLLNNREKCKSKRRDYQSKILDMIDNILMENSGRPYNDQHFEVAKRQHKSGRFGWFNAVISYLFQKMADVYENVRSWFIE